MSRRAAASRPAGGGRRGLAAGGRALLLAWACGLTACGGGGGETHELLDRLWVTDVPAGPREVFRGFAVADVRGRQVGAFYDGSVYDGRQRAFKISIAGDKVTFALLQEELEAEVRVRACRPSTGFHLCLELVGDPLVAGRYQSRKRWTLRRSKGAAVTRMSSIPMLLDALDEGASSDPASP